jgi:phosphoglucosamine mutase
MTRHYFGTDGVRGVANSILSPSLAMALGAAAVQVLGADRPLVVGRDPRISGPLLEAALVAGILSQGADIIPIGVVPTPTVSFATRSLGAAAGIVVSASHNPFADNGIKFFGPDGRKLADETELRIESALAHWENVPRPIGAGLGKVRSGTETIADYSDWLAQTMAPFTLDGLHLVLDCAHGAASDIAPGLFRRLGADVHAIGASPDGLNINDGVGSTSIRKLRETVVETGADAGIAFDGDADRALLVDRLGRVFDGDRVLCCAALAHARESSPAQSVVVGTVMSNLGLEHRLAQEGIRLERADVGDRYVMEAMNRTGARIGGEPSGHILFPELSPTGDGMLTALQTLRIVRASGRDLASWADEMQTYPQRLVNVDVADKHGYSDSSPIQDAIATARRGLERVGRINVRASGTENKIRVMVEAADSELVDRYVELVADAIRKERGI